MRARAINERERNHAVRPRRQASATRGLSGRGSKPWPGSLGALDRRVLDLLGNYARAGRDVPLARDPRLRMVGDVMEGEFMTGNDWVWPAIIVLGIFLWAIWTLRPMPPRK